MPCAVVYQFPSMFHDTYPTFQTRIYVSHRMQAGCEEGANKQLKLFCLVKGSRLPKLGSEKYTRVRVHTHTYSWEETGFVSTWLEF